MGFLPDWIMGKPGGKRRGRPVIQLTLEEGEFFANPELEQAGDYDWIRFETNEPIRANNDIRALSVIHPDGHPLDRIEPAAGATGFRLAFAEDYRSDYELPVNLNLVAADSEDSVVFIDTVTIEKVYQDWE